MDQLLQIRSEPPRARPACLDYGFRLFFFGAALWTVVSMALWVPAYLGHLPAGLFLSYGSPMLWHAHEMVYGYGMAVVTGFLLTAVVNWTGKQTLVGRPLIATFLVWTLARLLPVLGTSSALLLAKTADLLVIGILAVVTIRPCLAKGQKANVALLLAFLGVMIAGQTLFVMGVVNSDYGLKRTGVHLGLYALVFLVVFMGRRVIPMFIKGGTGGKVTVGNSRLADLLALPLFGLYVVCELWTGLHAVAPWVAIGAAVVLGTRLWAWWTPALLSRPLLWVLYAAYSWAVVALALRGAGLWLPLSPYLPLHAFSAGTVGMATMGMMARVALGHSGRSVQKPPSGVGLAFLLAMGAALLRVVAPLVWPAGYLSLMLAAQAAWIVAFVVFLGLHTRILFTKVE